MKSQLQYLPDINTLEKAYLQLLYKKPNAPTLEELALYTQWSRLDPRLAEILMTYLSQNFESINPTELRSKILNQPWPSVVGVLLEFSKKLVKAKDNLRRFRYWCKIVTDEIPMAKEEQFFIGLRELGGRAMFEDCVYASIPFRKWGYFSRESLISKSKFALPKESRLQILEELLAHNSRINTAIYLESIGGGISKRQAERDLKQCSKLKAKGNTKARYYSKVATYKKPR